MDNINDVNKSDMALIPKLLPFISPESVPISFRYGDRLIRGIPADFFPVVKRELIDSNITRITITGRNDNGLEIRAEYTEYRDFPVTEWVAYLPIPLR